MDGQKKVVVVGAGASGMMAAIAAARNGATVTLLEGMDKPGKKLLLTGNGRCNLTNFEEHLPDAYYGTGKSHASSLIRKFDAKAVCKFFEELGLLTVEKNGYVYPYSGQAGSVLEVLLTELRRCKVKLKLMEKVEELIQEADGSWGVRTSSWKYLADAVILSCGSCAVPATGSDGSGYHIASKLGHKIIKPAPALVSLNCKETWIPLLAGVRSRAKVTLMDAATKKTVKSDTGELQWTKYGVSGIVVFQLSRFVSSAECGQAFQLMIDLVPDFSDEHLASMLKSRAELLRQETVRTLLAGLLNEKIIPVVLELAENIWSSNATACANKSNKKQKKKQIFCQDLTEDKLEVIIHLIKNLQLNVKGTNSFDTAQVCAGGVDACQIKEETMESVLHPNLYFAGELVDTDGPCGGYNLQWAWSSGWAAGTNAAIS